MTAIATVRPSTPSVTVGTLESANPLPLVITPGVEARDVAGLVEWLEAERDWVAARLREHGAVLLRGFPVRTPADFERVARAVAPRLQNNYLGTSPRDAVTEYVFHASELPAHYPIPQHLEMSFTRTPPAKLFFHCMRAPSGVGGETPLVDFRRVLRDLDPAVRAKFEALGVRNIRNYDGPEGGSRFDLWKLKRWHDMFGTTDRAAVERTCREQGFEWQWKPGGRLALVNAQPAVRTHPETREVAWFNHSQVFHRSAVAGEYRRIARRQRPVQSRALALLADTLVAVRNFAGKPEDQAMHCTYGDGSEIPDEDMERVRDAIWKNLVAFRWEAGDVVAIDNFSVSHGRMPYRGPREITVCWA